MEWNPYTLAHTYKWTYDSNMILHVYVMSLWKLKQNITFCDMKSKYFWDFRSRLLVNILIRWCILHLSAIANWIDDKNNIKVEIAVGLIVVHKENNVHFLMPENIRVYEALARFARSRIYLKWLFFQLRSSMHFFSCESC